MQIHFETINPDNWRIFSSLKVKTEQEKHVASNVLILARAYVYRSDNSRVYAIYNENIPVGLLMQWDFRRNGESICILDQFMIGGEFQGKGLGKQAMQQWLAMLKAESKYNAVILCYLEGDEIARNLYQTMGFFHTGEKDEDEIVMMYDLNTL